MTWKFWRGWWPWKRLRQLEAQIVLLRDTPWREAPDSNAAFRAGMRQVSKVYRQALYEIEADARNLVEDARILESHARGLEEHLMLFRDKAGIPDPERVPVAQPIAVAESKPCGCAQSG